MKTMLVSALALGSLVFAKTTAEVVSEVEVSTDAEEPVCEANDSSCGNESVTSAPISARRGITVRDPPNRRGQYQDAMGVKFKNPRSYRVDYYWVPPQGQGEPVYQGWLPPKGVTATNSYRGHVFSFTKKGSSISDNEIARLEMTVGKNLYVLPCPLENEPAGFEDKECMNSDFYKTAMEESIFMDEYYNRHGYPWLANYGRGPPIHHIWPADNIGQKHRVRSNETFWVCPGVDGLSKSEDDRCRSNNPQEVRENLNDIVAYNGDIEFELEVIETHPKIFRINNLISDVESDIIKEIALPKIKRSLAGSYGGLVSNTRTSKNTWLGRNIHPVLTTLYKRASDILNITETILYQSVEDLQVVNYQIGQEYTSHHDFGAEGRNNQRIITLLLYLNDMENDDSGGETAFPKAKHGPLRSHPGQGNGILFYSMLDDGNADDLSLHAALPVKAGEKWICNFWVWDPKR